MADGKPRPGVVEGAFTLALLQGRCATRLPTRSLREELSSNATNHLFSPYLSKEEIIIHSMLVSIASFYFLIYHLVRAL